MRRRGLLIRGLVMLCVGGTSSAAADGPVVTRIVLDHTVGLPGAAVAVVPSDTGQEHRIPSSAGDPHHGNLFHSFSFFDVGAGDTAHFTQDLPGNFSNLVARVTGGDPSRVAGTLKSSVGAADVTLLNPAGVLFTSGARIDVPAGFHVSTADRLRMGRDEAFAARPMQGEMLSAAPPTAFGFLGPGAAGISIEGASLATSKGPASVIAGSVALSSGARIQTFGGDVSLVAVDAAGEVPRDARTSMRDAVGAGGPIAISDASVSAFGFPSTPLVRIEGGHVAVRGPTASVQVSGFETDPVGGIRVVADRLEVADSALLRAGNAGAQKLPGIRVDAREVVLSGGGTLDTRTSSAAAAGDITVHASESLSVSGRNVENQLAGITAFTTGAGDAGTVRVETGRLLVGDDAIVSARVSGGGGTGSGGLVDVSAGEVHVEGGARIEANVGTSGRGRPGRIEIRARDRVSLVGEGSGEELRGSTGLFADTKLEGGAEIRVQAPELTISDGAVIHAGTGVAHPGDAGTIALEVGRLAIQSGIVEATSLGSGRAGTIQVDAAESVLVDGGTIESRSLASGAGGLVDVQAPLLEMRDGGRIDIGAAQLNLDVPGGGDAGRAVISVDRLRMRDGAEIAAVARGDGPGGDVLIRARESVDLEGGNRLSALRASAEGDGPAGRVHVETPRLRLGEFSRIETSTTGASGIRDDGTSVSRRGRAGDVSIVADSVVVESRAEISSVATGPEIHTGDAGTVRLDVGSLLLLGSGQVRAGTETAGRGGSVVVRASREVRARVTEGPAYSISSVTGSVTAEGAGDGGLVRVEAPLLVLEGGASIAASSRGTGRAGSVSVDAGRIVLSGGGRIASDALGSGDAGPVEVRASRALVASGAGDAGPSGVSSRTAGPARGARVDVVAGDVVLRDGAEISATSAGTGHAGDVRILAADDLLMDRAAISTSAPLANGGNIDVRAGDRMTLLAGRIAADVGDGQGGNVRVAPRVLLLKDGSSITATAGAGQGGVIRIVADVVLRAQDALVSASAGAEGIDGTVRFETPADDFIAPLQALPEAFVDAIVLFGQRCAARHGATASFVVAAAPAPGTEPEALLPAGVEGDEGAPGRTWVVLDPGAAPGDWRARCGDGPVGGGPA